MLAPSAARRSGWWRVLVGGAGLLGTLQRIVPVVKQLEAGMERRTDAELRARTAAQRQQVSNGTSLDSLLPEAFALVGEAFWRSVGERLLDEQFLAGVALHRGVVVEVGHARALRAPALMLASYLEALAGDGVHVVASSDELAERQAERMGQVLGLVGVEVGAIGGQLSPADRRARYALDVTCGGYEAFGYDYLRDNLASSLDEVVQRGHAVALVDDADGVLVGHARALLRIVGPRKARQTGEQREVQASVSVGGYYRRYDKLAGISGSATGDAVTFDRLYGREVVRIPTGAPPVGTTRTRLVGGMRPVLMGSLLELDRRRSQARRRRQALRALEFEEVIDEQREAVYRARRQVLESPTDALHEQALGLLRDVVERAVTRHRPSGLRPGRWDLDGMVTALSTAYPVGISRADVDHATDRATLQRLLLQDAERALQARRDELGADLFAELVRAVQLSVLDRGWREQLQELTRIAERWTSQGGRLGPYRQEASSLFEERQRRTSDETVAYVFNASVHKAEPT
jgi:preprotein translocase subunit SecA